MANIPESIEKKVIEFFGDYKNLLVGDYKLITGDEKSKYLVDLKNNTDMDDEDIYVYKYQVKSPSDDGEVFDFVVAFMHPGDEVEVLGEIQL